MTLRNERHRHLDNTERLWCNCEVTWPNGDVYVINAGEARTYEFIRGSYDFDAYCGNGAGATTSADLKKASSPGPTTSIAKRST